MGWEYPSLRNQVESEKGPSATPTAGGSGVASQGRGHAFDQEEPLKDSARCGGGESEKINNAVLLPP